MAKAKRQNDEKRMDEIRLERTKLTEKRKEICLRMTGSKKAEIKEQRRLLAKKMAIARRRKDTVTMDQINLERQKLNATRKALNTYVQKVNYQKIRHAYMRPEVLALIQSKKRELVRTA